MSKKEEKLKETAIEEIEPELEESEKYKKANFSEKILWASQSKSGLQQYGNRARQYVMDNMTWQRKGVIINEIYRNLTSKIRNTEM